MENKPSVYLRTMWYLVTVCSDEEGGFTSYVVKTTRKTLHEVVGPPWTGLSY